MSVTENQAERDRRGRRALRRRWLRLLGVVAMCLPATQCLRNDEVDCEEAVKYMQDCCPGANLGAVQCEYLNGCDQSYPDLTPGESSCILGVSCNDLKTRDICGRVVQRSSGANDPGTESGLTPTGSICP